MQIGDIKATFQTIQTAAQKNGLRLNVQFMDENGGTKTVRLDQVSIVQDGDANHPTLFEIE